MTSHQPFPMMCLCICVAAGAPFQLYCMDFLADNGTLPPPLAGPIPLQLEKYGRPMASHFNWEVTGLKQAKHLFIN